MTNPFLTIGKIEEFIAKSTPFFLGIGAISLLTGLVFALFLSPVDYQQGNSIRITYIHLPSIYLSLMVFTLISGLGLAYLRTQNQLYYLVAKCAAPVGIYFTIIALVTGAIWGFPMWGTWWAWDARLTALLLLLFIYLGYGALSEAFPTQEREAKSASVLALVSFINIPIIKYSVEWWNSVHQPSSVFKIDMPNIYTSMLIPISLMTLAWICLFFIVLFFKIKTSLYSYRLAEINKPI